MLGSGVMGSRIACHFANIGVQVLLLDIPSKELTGEEKAKGLSVDDRQVRNRLVNASLQTAVKTNPSPIYSKRALKLIRTGNFGDHLQEIADADWIIEAVVENLDVKNSLYEQVEAFRKPGTIVTTNTSGIPVHMMAKARSEDFQKHFCGTHFFNPPRYLALLEIIPTAHTDPGLVDFLMHYGDLFLGKTTVRCKDTPAFIANRIGVFAIAHTLRYVQEKSLKVEEVDQYTGTLIGHPKSATFRTSDVVGLDTLVKVARGLLENCPEDEAREVFDLPAYVEKMVQHNMLGVKTGGQGFYKKVKNEQGKSEILSLDLETLEYGPQQKVTSPALEAAKAAGQLPERLKILLQAKDKAGDFFRETHFALFSYASNRIPEISDELFRVDDAIRAGFGWELGPFEIWDVLGVKETLNAMEQYGYRPAGWVYDMLETEAETFYRSSEQGRQFYELESGLYKEVPGTKELILPNLLYAGKTVWKNAGVTLTDLEDGILNCGFHTKMNTLGSEVIEGLNKAVDIAEKEFQGLVIANNGQNFSAGANLGLIFMYAAEQEWEEVELMVRTFQQTMMRLRYSSAPVVAAPHNMALGGSCEICLHADHVEAHAELYMGLVEFGAGIIPAGGGTKEFALRASGEFAREGIDELERLKERYLTIAMAKVSASAAEAFELGYLQAGKADITINRNRQITEAKKKALAIAGKGYTQPVPRQDIKVMGRQGLGMFTVGASNMLAGHYISEHDKKISEKLAWVICGGDLSYPQEVSEQYLLDLEREAFLSLCGEKKTLERMQSILKGGKVLRN